MTTLAAPTLFPLAPNRTFDVTLSRAWLTDVQRTRSGKEVRQAIRSVPARRLEYTISLARVPRLELFRNLWLTPAEPLRYLVPLWPEYATPTAFPDASTVTADTTLRAFVAGQYALLWRTESQADAIYELVMIDTLSAGGITTVDPTVLAWSTFPAGSVRLIPVMAAWLVPPTREQLTGISANVPLAFDEELPGIAGLDPAIGAATTPEGATITLSLDEHGSPQGGLKFFTVTANVFDASGQPIQDPEIVWMMTSTGDLDVTDPTVRISYPENGRQAHMEFPGDGGTAFLITATYGAVSATLGVSGVG